MPQLDNAYSVALTAVTGTTAGGCLSLANPFGEDVIISNLVLAIETPATNAANVDAGIAANGTTSSDTLIDGQSVGQGSARAVGSGLGTNGKPAQRWDSTEYLTITASATLAGLVGEAKIQIIRI